MFTSVLAYLSGILMIPGYLLGLLWHRSHDGWRAARMQLDSQAVAGQVERPVRPLEPKRGSDGDNMDCLDCLGLYRWNVDQRAAD